MRWSHVNGTRRRSTCAQRLFGRRLCTQCCMKIKSVPHSSHSEIFTEIPSTYVTRYRWEFQLVLSSSWSAGVSKQGWKKRLYSRISFTGIIVDGMWVNLRWIASKVMEIRIVDRQPWTWTCMSSIGAISWRWLGLEQKQNSHASLLRSRHRFTWEKVGVRWPTGRNVGVCKKRGYIMNYVLNLPRIKIYCKWFGSSPEDEQHRARRTQEMDPKFCTIAG